MSNPPHSLTPRNRKSKAKKIYLIEPDVTRKFVAKWLTKSTGLKIRGISDDLFIQDVADGVTLKVLLCKFELMNQKTDLKEMASKHHSSTKLEAHENITQALKCLHEKYGRKSIIPSDFRDFNREKLEILILPFFLWLKEHIDQIELATPDGLKKRRKSSRKKIVQALHELVQEEIAKKAIVKEPVEEAIGSLIGLLIFTAVMSCILLFICEVVGITDVGIASNLGIRKIEDRGSQKWGSSSSFSQW